MTERNWPFLRRVKKVGPSSPVEKGVAKMEEEIAMEGEME